MLYVLIVAAAANVITYVHLLDVRKTRLVQSLKRAEMGTLCIEVTHLNDIFTSSDGWILLLGALH